MEKRYFVELVINKERLSDKSTVFVAYCPTLGIASQGKDIEESKENIKEAIDLYLEEQPERFDDLISNEVPLFSVIEVKRSAKTANIVG